MFSQSARYTIKKGLKGRIYKCSDDCDFMYVVDECAGCMNQVNCPFCGLIVGGRYHKHYGRPGHQNLSNQEAKQILEQRIQKYYDTIKPGRDTFGLETSDTVPRGLNRTSYQILNIIMNTSMYSGLVLGLVSEEQMKKVFLVKDDDYLGFLERELDYKIMRLHQSLDIEQPYVWTYNVLSHLPQFIQNSHQLPHTAEIRDQFEKKFQNQIILKHVKSPIESIVSYKNGIKQGVNSQESILDYINQIRGNQDNSQKQYSLVSLFRNIGEPSIERMEKSLQILQNKKHFALIEHYFKNKAVFDCLKSFYPIVDFTNELMKIFNCKISREQARNMILKDVLNQHRQLKPKFKFFKKAWKNLGIQQFRYNCKYLSSPETISQKQGLIWFLVDQRQEGNGMYMASVLTTLAQMQNRILSKVHKIYSRNRKINQQIVMDTTSYNIQSIREENILNESINLHTLNQYTINNPDYGKGQQILYDFQRLQDNLFTNLMQKKFLKETKLNFVHYHFELLNIQGENSDLITQIKNSITQIPFTPNTTRGINDYFEIRRKQDKDQFHIFLREIHMSLNYILCFLKNLGSCQYKTIAEFSRSLKSNMISEQLKKPTPFSQIQLSGIVEFYEMVQIKYFPEMIDSIKQDFKKNQEWEQVGRDMKEMMKNCKNHKFLPDGPEVRNALMRLLMRFLTADLNPDDQIYLYMKRMEFWNCSEEKVEKLLEIFPQWIKLSHTYETYKAIQRFFPLQEMQKKKGSKTKNQKDYNQTSKRQNAFKQKEGVF